MTRSQEMRIERRRQRDAERRNEALQTAVAAVALALLLVAYGIVGAMDRVDEEREIALWEAQGVTIARW